MNEYYYDFEKWNNIANQVGMNYLNNESVELNINGQKLVIAGVTDRQAKKNNNLPMPNLNETLRNIDKNIPIILLYHRPENVDESSQLGVNLILSGHTHGGLVLGLNLIVKFYNHGFVSGLYDINPNTKLLVNNGIGIWSSFPFRFGVPSNIGFYNIKRE